MYIIVKMNSNILHILNESIPNVLTIIGPITAPIPYIPYEKPIICFGFYFTYYIKRTLIKT